VAGRLAAVWRSAVGGRPAIAEWAAGGIRSYRLPQSFRWSFRHARRGSISWMAHPTLAARTAPRETAWTVVGRLLIRGCRISRPGLATPPDSVGNGHAVPAETLLRTALSTGCSQVRCGRLTTGGGRRQRLDRPPPSCRSGRAWPCCASRQQHQMALVAAGRPEGVRSGVTDGVRVEARDAGVGATALQHRVYAVSG
jgi:hypothetical protein